MNILPKKRWHVRTKENIARVRKDEALAAEKQKEENRRIQLAESEARIRCMKLQQHVESVCLEEEPDRKRGHVNFFEELENGHVVSKAANADYEKEQKLQKEKYEKQIGYLTYLGQDTNEATGKTSWYNVPPSSKTDEITNSENDTKRKRALDPVNKYRKYFHFYEKPTGSSITDVNKRSLKKEQRKSKRQPRSDIEKDGKSKRQPRSVIEKDGKSKRQPRSDIEKDGKSKRSRSSDLLLSTSSDDDNSSEKERDRESKMKEQTIALLRRKRLQREKAEKIRADQVLTKLRGISAILPEVNVDATVAFEQKYNSQFNPQLARQNIK